VSSGGLQTPRRLIRQDVTTGFHSGAAELDDWFHRTDTQFFAACQPWLSQAIGNSVDIPGDYQGYSLEVDSSGAIADPGAFDAMRERLGNATAD